MWYAISNNELYHHGILGQKWGVRRFQNPDGSLTADGRRRRKTADDIRSDRERLSEKRAYQAEKHAYKMEKRAYRDESSTYIRNNPSLQSAKENAKRVAPKAAKAAAVAGVAAVSAKAVKTLLIGGTAVALGATFVKSMGGR